MLLERVPVAKLTPYAKNARTHSEAQLAMLARCVKEQGFAFPVVVNRRGEVIAGHARLEVAKRLQLEDVPVVRLNGLSEAQERALRLADNRIAELANWDEELLADELVALAELKVDPEGIGFDEVQLELLLRQLEPDAAHAAAADERAGEAGPEIARSGDLWELGKHRLLCGDATSKADVERLLAGEVPELMVTDPPYGVDYEPGWRNEGRVAREAFGVSREEKVANDDRADWREAWEAFPGAVAYVWHAALRSGVVHASLEAAGFEIRAQIVWAKQMPMISRGHYHWHHEPCWYAVRRGAKASWTGDRKQSTLWPVHAPVGYLHGDGADERQAHGTQKPTELYLRAFANHTRKGALVYDPFLDSGTALVACEKAGRRLRALELDPRCVDVALRRWRKFAGAEPTRDGRALAELEA